MGQGLVAYAALQGLSRLATPTEDEGPHRGIVLTIVPALLQHCSRKRFYLPTPCTLAPLEL
jgi:hypothetical protein